MADSSPDEVKPKGSPPLLSFGFTANISKRYGSPASPVVARLLSKSLASSHFSSAELLLEAKTNSFFSKSLASSLFRLKSFYEEGERERMSEQIMILENKLLKALDWKLMNESNCTTPKEKTSTGQSAINEENEFLRLQAFHKQGEIDLLRKKLDSCLDEKQKLERKMKNMEAEIEVVKSSQAAKEGNPVPQLNHTKADVHNVSLADQMELKAMVDAIAAASQREAKAHEMAITLSRENDELRRLGLYERAFGLYASMVNINAYHQPGVEEWKKVAAEVRAL